VNQAEFFNSLLGNGSFGRITGIVDGKVTVDFDGTEVELSGYGLEDLALAYATTVHKAHPIRFSI
jgi:ATP-dependent exoDNAse (exonuclease V) alpha subunit